jgi:hypothetical protein
MHDIHRRQVTGDFNFQVRGNGVTYEQGRYQGSG